MIGRLLFAAVAAGLLAGVVMTVVQAVKVTPMILKAETYEVVAPVTRHAHDAATPAHGHGEQAWAPEDGFERTAFTLLSNVISGVAFACLLGAAILFSNRRVSLTSGLAWGAAGYFAFSLAPAIGLPPELPGMAAADLTARQGWWLATVLASAGGLAAIAFAPRTWMKAAGLALIAVPHIVGAPQVEAGGDVVPAALAAEFAVASLVTAALFWLVLGASMGGILHRLERTA